MSLKRARAELHAGGYGLSDDWLREEDKEEIDASAAEFRRFLLGKYTDGSFTAADTCLLAYYHTQSGGRGAEDFALAPDQASTHGSQHLKPLKRHNKLFLIPATPKTFQILARNPYGYLNLKLQILIGILGCVAFWT